MGIKLFSRDHYDNPAPPSLPNPDPNNWRIVEHGTVNGCLIVKIQYPDCTNYEGMKILVYENITLAALRKQGKIDPHFSQNPSYKSPIARFEPTDRGWAMAVLFCAALEG